MRSSRRVKWRGIVLFPVQGLPSLVAAQWAHVLGGSESGTKALSCPCSLGEPWSAP